MSWRVHHLPHSPHSPQDKITVGWITFPGALSGTQVRSVQITQNPKRNQWQISPTQYNMIRQNRIYSILATQWKDINGKGLQPKLLGS